eukprot:CAMPEP_0117419084 /NCGR_PEP_ID=MMETSP0758-20121206/727_1 /TAXON_ID=63605 /ORGANISM="Percolomonas cosmopolitus, Strain AE-1 (ATCC 50343)" /LENGTH=94 /DNA_ID=CAMNT_0005199957 /DNA_START=457 /DNA_END=741 /DNA_ORIENTATION=-
MNQQMTKGDFVPSGRQGHTSIAYNGQLWIFGGNDSNQLIKFDPILAKFELIQSYGDVPHGRNHHSATQLDHYMYILGGDVRKKTCICLFASSSI